MYIDGETQSSDNEGSNDGNQDQQEKQSSMLEKTIE